MHTQIINKDALLATLPAQRSGDFINTILKERKEKVDTTIVLDDDPTGTQTVSDVPVLTSWEIEIIKKEFENKSPLFFILTNSRSLTEEEANTLAYNIGKNIQKAASATGIRYWVISRSDSTLRGHYPSEVTALEEGMGWKNSIQFLIPAFFEGGRYTINDIHYVQQHDSLVPAALTPYAKDKVFGYQNSNLVDWIIDKNKGDISKDKIVTISIEELRKKTNEDLIIKLKAIKKGSICIVNAASYKDLYAFSISLYKTDIQPIFRTAASFVGAISGLENKPLLTGASLRSNNINGGLIVVGSYVPTSTFQLKHLLSQRPDIHGLEIEVDGILDTENPNTLCTNYAQEVDRLIQAGKTVAISTSRKLVSVATEDENQKIGKTVSHFLTQIISKLTIQPSFILTKGGITSSDIATQSLGIKRAIVRGQIIKGVPVWQLGKEARFPNNNLIIFPGNVGVESSLTKVIDKLIIEVD